MKSLIEERNSGVDTDEERIGKMDSRIEKKNYPEHRTTKNAEMVESRLKSPT